MYRTLSNWFSSKPFQYQLIIAALILDPLGFLTGYLLAPSFGLDPIMGGVYGLIAAGFPISLLVMRRAQ